MEVPCGEGCPKFVPSRPFRSPRPGAPGILAQSPVHPGRGKLLPKAVAGNRFLILSSRGGGDRGAFVVGRDSPKAGSERHWAQEDIHPGSSRPTPSEGKGKRQGRRPGREAAAQPGAGAVVAGGERSCRETASPLRGRLGPAPGPPAQAAGAPRRGGQEAAAHAQAGHGPSRAVVSSD